MLHTGDQADAVGRIHAGREDLAVAACPDDLPGKLAFQTLMDSPLRLIAPGFDCSVSEQLGDVSGCSLAAIPFIVAMVGLGLGIGVVPQLVLDNFTHREQLRVIEVDEPLGPFPVGLCALRQRLENPLVAAFWETARRSYQAGR
jgi:LysR family positive regulator for ilvC